MKVSGHVYRGDAEVNCGRSDGALASLEGETNERERVRGACIFYFEIGIMRRLGSAFYLMKREQPLEFEFALTVIIAYETFLSIETFPLASKIFEDFFPWPSFCPILKIFVFLYLFNFFSIRLSFPI